MKALAFLLAQNYEDKDGKIALWNLFDRFTARSLPLTMPLWWYAEFELAPTDSTSAYEVRLQVIGPDGETTDFTSAMDTPPPNPTRDIATIWRLKSHIEITFRTIGRHEVRLYLNDRVAAERPLLVRGSSQ